MTAPPPPESASGDTDRPAPALVPAAEMGSYGASAVERALARLEAGRLSPAAATAFRTCVDAYAADLVAEALRVADRHQADVVSPAYVQQASGYLVARTRDRKFVLLGSLGAILLGVAIPMLLEVPWAAQISAARVLLSAAFGMAGSLLLAMRFVQS